MARPKKYIIKLTDDEVKKLKSVIRKKDTSRTIRSRCQIILDMDELHGRRFSNEQCAKSNGVCITTVTNTIRKYISGGIDKVIKYNRNINSDNARRKVDGKTEAHIIEIACSIFAFIEPLGGRHHVSVREHRTAVDWAEEIKYLVDVMYPNAEKVILVMDNLNTHKPASLYQRYPASEARRIMKKLEIHFTPKHGSWLDIAEIELNVMTRQCLSRRIDNIAILRMELASWESERNSGCAKVNWQFRTTDARIRLASLYLVFITASE